MSGDRIYAPFEAPHRMAMGLMRLPPEEWLEVDGALADDLALKRRLLAERRMQVLALLPQSEAAQAELLALLASHLERHHAATHRREGAAIEVLPAGARVPLGPSAEPALARAALLVQEDLCLMEQDGQDWVLTAGCVCFPTRWRLPEKLGRPLAGIHAPVPGFAERLGRPVERFFDKLMADRPVWRLNWSLIDDPALFQPGGHGRSAADPTITAENAGERLWLRVERQTLTRLPQTGAVLFAIRIHRWPVAVLSGRPDAAARLAAAMRSMPEALQRYKSLPVFGEALLAWLDRAAAGGGPQEGGRASA